MKITIVLGPFQPLPPVGFGAVEKVWYEFAQAFARLGHEVVVMGKTSSAGDGLSNVFGIQIVPFRGFSATGRIWKDLVKDFLYAIQITRRIEPADVIVTNTFWTPVLLPLFGLRLGKIIVHVARFPKRQMWLYRGADALQAISSAVAREICRQTPCVETKVYVLPYPVDLRTYRPPPVARRYDGDLIVLYAGRVHAEKGIDLLIPALRQLLKRVPRARLRIVGPVAVGQGGGGEVYLETLRSAATGLPVEFVGPIREPAALALEYQRAHCFCYPSLAEKGEALGLSVLEAMATAVPVIVSDLACFRDFIAPGHDGLIFDHRAPAPALALAELLAQILSDPEFAFQLGRNAVGRAQEFELDRIARRYVAFFEEIART